MNFGGNGCECGLHWRFWPHLWCSERPHVAWQGQLKPVPFCYWGCWYLLIFIGFTPTRRGDYTRWRANGVVLRILPVTGWLEVKQSIATVMSGEGSNSWNLCSRTPAHVKFREDPSPTLSNLITINPNSDYSKTIFLLKSSIFINSFFLSSPVFWETI